MAPALAASTVLADQAAWTRFSTLRVGCQAWRRRGRQAHIQQPLCRKGASRRTERLTGRSDGGTRGAASPCHLRLPRSCCPPGCLSRPRGPSWGWWPQRGSAAPECLRKGWAPSLSGRPGAGCAAPSWQGSAGPRSLPEPAPQRASAGGPGKGRLGGGWQCFSCRQTGRRLSPLL